MNPDESPLPPPPTALPPPSPPRIVLDPIPLPYLPAPAGLGDIPLALPVAWPAPAAPPAKPASPGGLDLLIGVALAMGAELFLGMVAVLPAVFSGRNISAFAPAVRSGETLAALDPDFLSPPMILLTGLSSGLFATAVAWYFTCRRYGRSFAEGLAINRVGIGQILLSIAIGVAGAVAGMACFSETESGDSMMSKLISTPEGRIIITVLAVLLPPLEEIYYRGFIFPIIRRYVGPGWAILLVTLWFGGVHVPQLAGDWAALVIVTCMGAIWTLQRHLTKSLVPSMITHWVYNLCLTLPGLLLQ